MENKIIKCKVQIDRIMFPKNKQIESGDYAIFTVKIKKVLSDEQPIINHVFKNVSLKGIVPHIKEGMMFTMTFGDPETNDYGTTYHVFSTTKEIDESNLKEVKEYLELMCGVETTKELIKLENPYQLLINRCDEELLKVKGIGKARLKQIYKNMSTYSDNSYALAKLVPLGLTKTQVNNICYAVGGAVSAVDVCMKNPYSLIDKVRGISFIIADTIALKCGHDINSSCRLKYAVMHILMSAGENGKSYLTMSQLMRELNGMATAEISIVYEVMQELCDEGKIAVSADGNMVASVYYLKLEEEIANELKRLRDAESKIIIPDNWRETVSQIEDSQGWNYTDEQLRGIETVLKNNVVVVTGKAGTGKSTVTNAMCDILDDYTIKMCCLSAKASQRLTEVTGREAETIHRMLGLGMGEDDSVYELFADIVIIDEASMPSGTLLLKVFKAMESGSKLIILGDDGQLTPIGDCSVFSDLLKSKNIPVVCLTEIHRQAKKSAITTKSIDIRNQIPIYEKGFRGYRVLGELQDLELFIEENNSKIMDILINKFVEDLNITHNVMEVQIITAMKKRGDICTTKINEEIQKKYNPNNLCSDEYIEGVDKVKIFKGDKVINLKNNYNSLSPDGERRPVFNGSIGIVKDIQEDCIIIDFIGVGEVELKNYENINLAYAVSCHSSQGSQWKRVICAFDMGAYVLLNVEMLYTAVTRASEHCALIVEDKAFLQALRTVEQKTKQTLLSDFLKN